MASKKVVVAECDRCARKNRSAATVRFSYGGRDYELELCEPHQQALDRDLTAWARVAREVEKPRLLAKTPFVVTREREIDRAAVLLAEQHAIARMAAFVLAPKGGMSPPPDGTVVVAKKPPHFDHWKISRHAKERMSERHVTESEVRWCASAPHLSIPEEIDDEGKWIYRRGDVMCVVNPETREVITVMRASSQMKETVGAG